MPDITVEVHDRDIIVAKPSVGLSISYRKEACAPLLVAIDDMRRDPTPEELRFLPRAWKAAYEKARSARLAKLTENERHAYAHVQYGAEVPQADIRAH